MMITLHGLIEYKKEPEKYLGHVGDVCEIMRVVVTGRRNSPDLFQIMKIMGIEEIKRRINLFKNYQNNK